MRGTAKNPSFAPRQSDLVFCVLVFERSKSRLSHQNRSFLGMSTGPDTGHEETAFAGIDSPIGTKHFVPACFHSASTGSMG
jgi:hypothetical protein